MSSLAVPLFSRLLICDPFFCFQRDAILVLAVSLTLLHVTASQDTSPRVYDPLKQSEFLKAKAMLRWLINNRTENNTQVFNAGFIRLAFHDCVGGCDGCINMQNPGNVGEY